VKDPATFFSQFNKNRSDPWVAVSMEKVELTVSWMKKNGSANDPRRSQN